MSEQVSALHLGLLLRQAHRKAARALDMALQPLSLSGRHFGVLLLLHREGSSTQRDLIARTGSDKAGMTRTVDELDRRGYLVRSPSARDRRLVHLALSAQGEAAYQESAARAEAVSEQIFGPLTDEGLVQLSSLLTRLVADGPT